MNTEKENKGYKKIPSVSKILQAKELADYTLKLRTPVLKNIIYSTLNDIRRIISDGTEVPSEKKIILTVKENIERILRPSLQPVINASGVILHTNLGRAPLGEETLENFNRILTGYNNLEFDLQKAQRGDRNSHLSNLLSIVLNTENSVVVNNNAAALYLVLKELAAGKEVIVSRGELVEIGGSFRIPDIIRDSGASLIEVGTTNKTDPKDYESAVNEDTALILKVHKSNYYMQGFVQEVSVRELSKISRKHKIPLVFDLGTGLLDNTMYKGLENEPDIKTALEDGADIVTTSCDKILGGPQAGIITGKDVYIRRFSRHPLMRVLRVDKMTISALTTLFIRMMYSGSIIEDHNPVMRYINREISRLQELANVLSKKLTSPDIKCSIIDNNAQCGGGTLPYHIIKSKAVMVEPKGCPEKVKKTFAETLYNKLLSHHNPVLGILREGTLIFDVLTLEEDDIKVISKSMKELIPFWEKS